MDNDATSVNTSSQIRQKRVLPSRTRRGGPGVGNCDVDIMILNTQINKSENEPLIPADTRFLMSTNDTLEKITMEFSSSEGAGINLRTHESYFERPEVLKAYREQTIIETPEYTNLSEVPTVGARLRARNTEEQNSSDSDVVYEKRHRKYEAFEKRQRLREKEKLKHEQYKLKERIEQLRAMDNSAFLAAPASSFSPRPASVEVDEEESIIGGHPNGSSTYHEGERRRKEMLQNAQALEERYRVLLPPDRHKKPAGQSSVNASIESELELSAKEFVRHQEDGESEVDEELAVPVIKKDSQKLKLKLPARTITTASSIMIPKAVIPSKKRRRSSLPPPFLPPPPPPPPLPRSPAAPRKIRVVPGASSTGDTSCLPPSATLVFGPVSSSSSTAQQIPDSMSVAGPSVLSHREIVPSLQFMPYEPATDNRQTVKQGKQRGGRLKRPSRKRAKTEEFGLPSPPRDRSASLPEAYIVVDDDPISHKRSSSPAPDASMSYSYPPPPPPGERYSPSPETSVPPQDASISPGPISPLGSTPSYEPEEPREYYTSLRRSSPALAEGFKFAPSSVPPPEPPVVERESSVPPIESISAPVIRRGRSRGVKAQPPPRKPQKRRAQGPCDIIITARRAFQNPRMIFHSRHKDAFGAKLPPILTSPDSYDYELPEVVTKQAYMNGAQDPDYTQETEGTEGLEDLEHRGPESVIPDDAEDPEETDLDLDGT
ncbi:hypothetical protein B0H10DRAFT_482220 [Mycena sp. CBHHK59/15]|nr:hypothetical protein B0H10DRAFT_482220 [Mycena sp. CBHHK59/15]